MNGPSVYDDVITEIRKTHNAAGVLLIIIGGDRGCGSGMQATRGVVEKMASCLRDLADEIEHDGKDPSRFEEAEIQ